MRGSVLAWFAATAAWLAVSSSAQSPTIVSGGGSALQLAIAAASPGDVLIVRAGTYGAVVVDRGVAIRCDPGVQLRSDTAPVLHVAGIPAGQNLRWSGGEMTWTGRRLAPPVVAIDGCVGDVSLAGYRAGASGSVWVHTDVLDCVGTVVMRQLDSGTQVFDTAPFRIRRCTAVLLQDCPQLPLLGVTASDVVLDQCRISPRNAAISMTLSSGTITLHDSTVVGGLMFSAGYGLAGAELFGGELRLSGAASIGNYFDGGGVGYPLQDPAVVSHGGRIVLGPAAELRSGLPNPVSGPAVVDREPLPSLRVAGARAGGTLALELRAAAGGLAAVFVGVPLPGALPTPFGPLWLAPSSPVLLLASVPADGLVTSSGSVPTTLAGARLILQPVAIDPVGGVGVGAPRVVDFD